MAKTYNAAAESATWYARRTFVVKQQTFGDEGGFLNQHADRGRHSDKGPIPGLIDWVETKKKEEEARREQKEQEKEEQHNSNSNGTGSSSSSAGYREDIFVEEEGKDYKMAVHSWCD